MIHEGNQRLGGNKGEALTPRPPVKPAPYPRPQQTPPGRERSESRSTEDWLLDKLKEIRNEAVDVVEALRKGPCWCEAGIDNPMMGGAHSAACERARRFVVRYQKRMIGLSEEKREGN